MALLDLIYADLRYYGNNFQPVMKLTSRTRLGSKVHKKYDVAKTPHQRVMMAQTVEVPDKLRLHQTYLALNPVVLLARIEDNLNKLWRLPR